MTDNLTSLVANLYDIRKQRSALEKVEKTILAEIKPLVDPQFDELNERGEEAARVADGIRLLRIQGTSRSISSDLLLERGVAPDIIAYCTKTTNYYQYRVKEVKE